jgi:hypothetical protein
MVAAVDRRLVGEKKNWMLRRNDGQDECATLQMPTAQYYSQGGVPLGLRLQAQRSLIRGAVAPETRESLEGVANGNA